VNGRSLIRMRREVDEWVDGYTETETEKQRVRLVEQFQGKEGKRVPKTPTNPSMYELSAVGVIACEMTTMELYGILPPQSFEWTAWIVCIR
jgi:hypothetical protein